jgi:hypothetical protein
VFVTSQGSPYSRFRRALESGNLLLIRSAAGELPSVDLKDALQVCLVLREAEPESFERAAVRWLGRYCLERNPNLAEIGRAAGALERLPSWDQDALLVLRGLVR